MTTTILKLNNQHTKSQSASKTRERFLQFDSTTALVLNIMFLAVSALLIVYYIIGANSITSNNYKIKLLIDRLAQINEEQNNLLIQKAIVDESLAIRNFAHAHNMVEAKNISHIFESSNVAQR